MFRQCIVCCGRSADVLCSHEGRWYVPARRRKRAYGWKYTLATAVVQVFLAQPPNSWTKRCCGVACFVKDNSVRSYFIRVYDIVNGMKFWEQELYNQFKYIVADGQPFFHTFETDTCWAALNFANDAEAGDFCNAIEAKLRAKMQRKQGKEDKKRRAPEAAVPNRPKHAPPVYLVYTRNLLFRGQHDAANIQPPSPTMNTTSTTTNTNTATSKKKDKKGKGKKYKGMDPDVLSWLKHLGLNESDIQDKKNVEVINQFVDEHGGINAFKHRMSQRSRMPAPPPPPPSPGSAAPPPPPGNCVALPPPPPSRGPAPPLPPSSRGAPPPPPPSRALPPTPPSMAPPSMLSRPMAAPAPPPPTPSGGGGTPTSPPPPAVGAAPPPPPIVVGGGRGRIDDIHKGTAFKRVDPDDQTAPASSGRGALLDQIRGGKALKKVDMSDREAEVAPSFSQDDLGASLLNALRIRNCVIHSGNACCHGGPFSYKVIDPDLQNWLENLGLDESQIQDEKNVEFINKEVKNACPSTPPPSPGTAAPPPPPGNRVALLPPPPSHGPAPKLPPSSRRGAPNPPSRALPPTPPSMAPPSMHSRPMAAPAPPLPTPSQGGGPLTSPPPPLPAVGAAPPPPPIRVEGGRGRMGLIDDIHKGVAFKRVDPDDRPAPASSGRGALLDQIRGGKVLKKVDMSDREAEVAPSVSQDDLGASLLNALRIRNCVIHSEDSDDDSDDDDFDDDDEEWE
ncbi:neural Wiskott-Aldrich syndrome protein-like [Patiria miniata]|uniref:Wiskott-Aldrich syndrome protein n=1 Tax=Patiria miniata TaxID=46514 RepID=A0A914ASX4_PATMI|nr:neural Wiskott-Aldrich syndrome protein-like [Patiria miniata]